MKYPFEVYRMNVEGHEFWVAESKSLKGCVAQGDSCQDALDELELNEKEWLATAMEYGIEIPAIPYEKGELFSGKFTVRVSPSTHQTAAEHAKKQGISLNQYVNDAIVAMNTGKDFREAVRDELKALRSEQKSFRAPRQAESLGPFPEGKTLVLSTKQNPLIPHYSS